MYKYPCTGYIPMDGFGSFLEKECDSPRSNINKFANELSEKFEIPYLVLVNSGSSANLVALMALAEKLKKAGRPLTALTSAFTFPTTVSALILAGFKVIFGDVDSDTGFLLDTERYKDYDLGLVVLTHFLGFRGNTEPFVNSDTLMLQDACETMGMFNKDGKHISADGTMTTWSFYHPHHMSAYGGGAVLCNTEEDFIIADSVAHWGRMCACHVNPALCRAPQGPAHQFSYERVGLNVEISELNACFGRWQLQKFEENEKKRNRNYSILYNKLCGKDNMKVFKPNYEGGFSPFVFPIVMKNMTMQDAYDKLAPLGVEIRTLMGGVSVDQIAFKGMETMDNLENARHTAKHGFFVGIHQTLPEKNVHEVANILYEL